MIPLCSYRRDVVLMLLAWIVSCVAVAHTTRGHNVIEAAAYKNLLKKRRGEILRFPDYSGKDILDYLIAHQILRVPPCYPVNGERTSPCANYTGLDSLSWLPIVGSGDMDAIMYRQFSSNGQYFHFMASPGAIPRAPELDPRTRAPHGLADEAYPRVLKFLTGTFYDMLERGKESKRYYRDIYSLIHTVGDSYSDAHAERDTSTWEIQYLKPWQATCWQPFLVNWSGWPYFFTDIMHRFPEDIRDKQYLLVELVPPDEVTYYDKNPYLVPRHYLNARGVQASDAVEDLLVTIFAILKETEQDQDKFVEVATPEWRGYLDRHFRCTVDTKTIPSLVVQPAPAEDQEWRPMIQVGIKGRNGSVPNAKDVVLAMDFAKPPSYVDPFGFAAGYDIGRRTVKDQTLWVGTVSFSLYLWQYTDYFATGIDPVIAELTYDNHVVTVEPMISFLRLDAWISRRVWLSVEGLRYSLSNGFRSNEFSLTLGLAFSREFPIQWTDWFTRNRYLEEIGTTVGNNWKTPDVDSPSRANPPNYGFFHPFGYGFYKEPGHTSIFPTGYTFLHDIRGQSKFSHLAYGLNFGVGGEHYRDETWALARLGPVGRFKLNELLAFQVEPVAGVYRWGLSKDAPSKLDAEATASMILSLGSFDLEIQLLRYSFDKKGLDQKAIAGVRLGVLRE